MNLVRAALTCAGTTMVLGACSDNVGVTTVTISNDQAAAILYLASEAQGTFADIPTMRVNFTCPDSTGSQRGLITDSLTFVNSLREPDSGTDFEQFQDCGFFGLTLNGSLTRSFSLNGGHPPHTYHVVGSVVFSRSMDGRCWVDFTKTVALPAGSSNGIAITFTGTICDVDAAQAYASLSDVLPGG